MVNWGVLSGSFFVIEEFSCGVIGAYSDGLRALKYLKERVRTEFEV